MNLSSVIAIVVACIGVIGSIVGVIIQSKKQGDLTVDVHTDTQAIRPKVDNIDENTKKIRDEVVEKLVPKIKDFSKMSEKIDFIQEDVRYRQRLQSESSLNLNNKDYFLGGIEKLYEINGMLENENRQLKVQLAESQEKNQRLQNTINALTEINGDLSNRLREKERKSKSFDEEFEIEI